MERLRPAALSRPDARCLLLPVGLSARRAPVTTRRSRTRLGGIADDNYRNAAVRAFCAASGLAAGVRNEVGVPFTWLRELATHRVTTVVRA